MRGRTYLAEFELPGVPVLDTDIGTYTVSFGAGVFGQMVTSGIAKIPSGYSIGAENDAPILESVRLLSNFADGFVWTSATTAVFAFWHGNNVAVPASYIKYVPRTLNEWQPVQMPLPRDVGSVSIFGGCSLFALGDMVFNIAGLSPDFDGAEVLFRLQCQFHTALW